MFWLILFCSRVSRTFIVTQLCDLVLVRCHRVACLVYWVEFARKTFGLIATQTARSRTVTPLECSCWNNLKTIHLFSSVTTLLAPARNHATCSRCDKEHGGQQGASAPAQVWSQHRVGVAGECFVCHLSCARAFPTCFSFKLFRSTVASRGKVSDVRYKNFPEIPH